MKTTKFNFGFAALTLIALTVCVVCGYAFSPEDISAFVSYGHDSTLQVIAMGTGLVPMKIEDLRKEAKNLSSFNGRRTYYTGEGDDLLQFNGDSPDFTGELQNHLEKQFVLSIANANAATRTAVLFAGYLKGNATLAPGQLVQGAFNDKNGNAGLTGNTESEKSIEELLLYLGQIPTRLIAIQMQSDVSAQLQQAFKYQRLNPFKTEPTKILRPSNYRNQDSFQDKLVSFPVDVQIDTLSYMEAPVVGTSTLRLTFFFGTSFNPVLALEKKSARALGNLSYAQQNAANKALLTEG